MASQSLRSSTRSFRKTATAINISRDPLMQCLAPHLTRTMATETSLPTAYPLMTNLSRLHPSLTPSIPALRPAPPIPSVLTTIYSFPDMEPLRFAPYPSNHLHLPLRRDILHRAIIYEADAARQGTAHVKHRSEVAGSSRKIRPQKGTGSARLGDKKSPMLRGGGHAFGKVARDFSSKLPRKVYDLAWRMALSYRYRRGELIIVDKIWDLKEGVDERWVGKIMRGNGWGNRDGRSLVVSRDVVPGWRGAMEKRGRHGVWLREGEVDVKDLLGMGRLIFEKRALDGVLAGHVSDLVREVPRATYD